MIRFLKASLFLIAACYTAAALAQGEGDTLKFRNDQKWALVVGVDNYVDLGRLQYCGNDARTLRDCLAAAGFPRSQIYMLAGDGPSGGQAPRKANIGTGLSAMLQRVRPGDMVLVAFSGHGVCIDGKSYFCPEDCQAGPDQFADSLGIRLWPACRQRGGRPRDGHRRLPERCGPGPECGRPRPARRAIRPHSGTPAPRRHCSDQLRGGPGSRWNRPSSATASSCTT